MDNLSENFDFEQFNINEIKKFDNYLLNNENTYFESDEFIEPLEYYLYNKKIEEFKKILDLALYLYPDSLIFKLFSVELNLFENKNNPTIKELEEIIEEYKHFSFNESIKIAILLDSFGSTKKSITFLNKKLKTCEEKDDIVEYKDLLSIFYSNIGDLNNSISQIQEIIYNYQPESYHYHNYIYNILEDTGKYLEGILFFNKLIDKNAYNSLAWSSLGKCYVNYANKINKTNKLLSETYLKKAITTFEYVLTINESDSEILFEISQVYYNKKDYEKSIHYLNILIKIEGIQTDTYLMLGKNYYKLKKYNQALKYLKILYHKSPNNNNLLYYISKTYYSSNQLNKALLYINKSINQKNNNQSKYFYLKGCILEEQEKINHALNYFLKSYKLDNNIKSATAIINLTFTYKKEIKHENYLFELIENTDLKVETLFKITKILIKKNNLIIAHKILHKITEINPIFLKKSLKDYIKKQNNPYLLNFLNTFVDKYL